tara:strand:- start:921 stop:1121 length:201 start_codon:yes stop_codon:yes gene_type:complete
MIKQIPTVPKKTDKYKKQVSNAPVFSSRESALKHRKEKGGTVAIDMGSYHLYIFPNGSTSSIGKPK